MRAVVTGAAGFIGSTLCEHLVDEGHDVVGVDNFTDYYEPAAKEANLASRLRGEERFELRRLDLATADLDPVFEGAEVVWHLAGQPGVRLSWSEGFASYVERNVLATQRVLEAARRSGVGRVVYASSSSVYGNAERYPTKETDRPEPYSPYGVTKLAAEHLCVLYAANWGLPTVSLRYFTVYGPRQRPDMAHHRLCEAAIGGSPFPLYGDGSAVRSFTYVDDVVAATAAAGTVAGVAPGTVLNVAGGSEVSMRELIDLVGQLAGSPLNLEAHPAQAGDATRTGGDITAINAALGWAPTTSLADGVAAQLSWHRNRRSAQR